MGLLCAKHQASWCSNENELDILPASKGLLV